MLQVTVPNFKQDDWRHYDLTFKVVSRICSFFLNLIIKGLPVHGRIYQFTRRH